MKKLSKPLCSLLAIPLAVLPLSASRPVSTLANEPVSVWITTGDHTKLLQPQANVSFSFSSTAPASGTAITVNEGTTYQSLDGFGATMTGSSAYWINRRLSATQRNALLNDLFGSGGIRLGFLRHTVGGSDFSAQGDFTYNDRPQGQTDPNPVNFSIANDLVDLVPVLKAAYVRNPNLKIMGSPWSAPAWMWPRPAAASTCCAC